MVSTAGAPPPPVAVAAEPPTPPGPLVKGNLFEDCLFVLINLRVVLSASYALGYFIPDSDENDRRAHDSAQVWAAFLFIVAELGETK